MQEWTRTKRDAGPGELNLALVVDAELFRLDSVIRWLDSADARLRRADPTTEHLPATQTTSDTHPFTSTDISTHREAEVHP